MTQIWVVVALIWFGVVVSGFAGDLGTSAALGQLVVALVTLLFMVVNTPGG
jgi:ABC-type phosphate transport system permease subunit